MVNKGEFLDYADKLNKNKETHYSTEMEIILELVEKFKLMEQELEDLKREVIK